MQNNDSFEMFRGTEIDSDESPDLQMKILNKQTIEYRFLPDSIQENFILNEKNRAKSKTFRKYLGEDWVILNAFDANNERIHRIHRNLMFEDDETDFYELCQEKKWRHSEFKHLIFNPKSKTKIFIEHITRIHKTLTFSNELIKKIFAGNFSKEKLKLKLLGNQKKVLFVEMENTLVAPCASSQRKNDFKINFFDESRECFVERIYSIRPHCKKMLEALKKFYDIYVFSSEIYENVSQLTNNFDPKQEIFSGILSREHCIAINKKIFIKDLDIFINKSSNDLVLIDSVPLSFALQIENGVPVLPWYGDPNDEEFKYLKPYLLTIKDFMDVKEANRKWLKILDLLSKNLCDLSNAY